ncbi:Peptidoglycan/LPS O-acetylase OafA/YrhL, contains acyltransferase and SGNH-hydrolase domains [Singulisphaera sp. GP187]|uniref:acyltransferase family protein n=1 Tax=Singulisphaera sp. GP187 TaxID=1882752 RepID=UPI00092CADC7|nr:acyltransferase [Singulisphaera sp. GP187]SIO35956.1 Peptidoglycan/LPS O-acetylase OafA/YrhL, contains acyltransferase and SGNH-hydrolase domains [Singulisphaera sp. GP187]
MKSNSKYALIDSFRGLACLGVLAFHATLYGTHDSTSSGDGPLAQVVRTVLNHLYVGVPVFFVISGYCITAASESAMRRADPLMDFFKRRFRRIYPSYWLVLGLTVVLLLIVGSTDLRVLLGDDQPRSSEAQSFGAIHHLPDLHQLTLGQVGGNLTLTETWLYLIRTAPTRFILPTAWTLCYEEQFYAVCALLLLWPAFFYRGVGAVTLITSGVLLSKFLGKVLGFSSPRPVGLFVDGAWLTFAMGIFVYRAIHHWPEQRRRSILVALFVSGSLVLAQCVKTSLYHYLFSYSVAAVFSLVLLVAHPHDRALALWRPLRLLAWVGEFSYSLYLVHYPITELLGRWFWMHEFRGLWTHVLVVLPITGLLSIALSRVFFLFVEQRFLQRPEPIGDPAPFRSAHYGRPADPVVEPG